jgi:hypothetical protein
MNQRGLLRALVPAAFGAVAILNCWQAAAAQSTSCRPTDDLAARTVDLLRDYVTSTDSFSVKMAKALHITGTNPNRILYSTDSKTCRAAVRALNKRFGTPGRPGSVYVWIVGRNYAVEDADQQSGMSYRAVLFFTRKWEFKSGWAPN